MTTISIEDALTDANLFDAWDKVRSNQGCAGIDGVTIEEFGRDLWPNLQLLRNEVHYGTYRPLPLLRVEIEKESGGSRPLSIPVVRDRVLQTAVAQTITPVFEAEFEDASFAYRKGRSVNQAVARIERLRNAGYRWVVDADIRTYFDEIDHDLLMVEVENLIGDRTILALIRQWLKPLVVDGRKRYRLSKGVPQGSPISPMLANLYLDRLDEALLDGGMYLVRYGDDCVPRRRTGGPSPPCSYAA